MARKKVGKRRLREAAEQCNGNLLKMAEICNVSRQTIYNYLKADYAGIQSIVESARNTFVDQAEQQLHRHVMEINEGYGDFQAIKFVLQTWGKDRGWSPRTEVTGADGASLFDVRLDDEVIAYLEKAGIDREDVMSYAARQFNEIIKGVMAEEKSE